jgi:amino acid adenylation domain-containing protein
MLQETMPEAIHQIVRRTAERRADHVAVEAAGRRLSYRELLARAHGLAAALLAAGAGKGALVGLLASRTEDLAAGMLGVLEAGCAFVPLDRRSPAVRLEAIVAEVGPRWWLVSPDLSDLAGELRRETGGAATVIQLGDQGPRGERAPTVPEPDPESLCYVFFTSGSTGRPKGIAGRLKAIDHFISWEIETFAVDERCRVGQLTSPAFDAILRDVFVPLAAGGTVCAPADREVVLDGARLADWIGGARLTLLHCTPSIFRTLLRQDLTAEHFPALRHVLLAGEPLLPADVRRWSAVFGGRIELVNLYGPSETTMTKLFYRVQPADGEARMIPVGLPMPGARALVLDEKGSPCPPGQAGEIVLRTPYRSLGYLNQPELTAAVFVRNPWSDRPDDLIYRTGDLGRVREDGLLEVLGRRDQQVKVRGVRVEIAPIEEALRSHPAVRDAAVIDRTDAQGDKILCAYLVLGGDPAVAGLPGGLDAGELREHLAARLPEAMIPSAFVRLAMLPRTLTGKLDRRGLPDFRELAGRLGAERVAPRTPLETRLAALFAASLGVPEVGVRDSFFALGGHSLLAFQLLARIRAELGVAIPLGRFLEAATVEALAAEMPPLQPGSRAEDEIPLQPEAASYPLSFAQHRLWLIDQVEKESPFYNIAAAVRLTGPLRVDLLRRAAGEIARRHQSLRTIFIGVDGEPSQVIQAPRAAPLPLLDLRGTPDREQIAARLARQEAHGSFDLSRGPLSRGRLLRLAAEEHVLLWVVHHIVADGGSLEVLIRELTVLYGALSRGVPARLPDLPVQYRDFAVWQRQLLQGDALAELRSYWHRRLAGAPPLLRLAADRARPPRQSFRGARLAASLPAELGRQVAALAAQEGCTIFMTLLGAFAAVLHQGSNQRDLVVGAPFGARHRPELEGLIGLFVNALPLRIDLSGDPTFRELLARVRGEVLEAFRHQQMPFEKLVEDLHPERGAGYNPLFQVTFNVVEGDLAQPLAMPGVTVTPFPFARELTQFDLSLTVVRRGHDLTATFQYSTDLFDELTVAWMGEDLRQALDEVTAAPDTPLSRLREVLAAAAKDRRAALAEQLQHQQDLDWSAFVREVPRGRAAPPGADL